MCFLTVNIYSSKAQRIWIFIAPFRDLLKYFIPNVLGYFIYLSWVKVLPLEAKHIKKWMDTFRFNIEFSILPKNKYFANLEEPSWLFGFHVNSLSLYKAHSLMFASVPVNLLNAYNSIFILDDDFMEIFLD